MSITHVPPSIVILLRRIEYWNEQHKLSQSNAGRGHCEAMLAELNLVLKEVKEK